MNRFLASTAAVCFSLSVMPAVWAGDAAPAAGSATAQPKTMQDAIDQQIAAARNLRLEGKFEDAAKAFRQLLLVAQDNPQILGEYGKTLAQQGHAQDAVTYLKRATQLQPNDWTLFSALGVADDQLDKHTDAQAAYDRALALKPGEPSVLNNYAVSRMLTGDYDGAHKMLDQVQAAGTSDPKLAGNLAKLSDLEAAHTAALAAAAKAAPPQPAHPAVTAAVRTQPPAATAVAQKAPSPQPTAPSKSKPAPAVQAQTTPAAKAPPMEAKNNGTVVMEKVPVDPLAGPVKARHATGAPRVLATAKTQSDTHGAAAKSVATSLPAPTLRTAADSN